MSMNVATLANWVARAQAQPGKLNATAVSGFTEFVFDYFVKTTGLEVQKIPYRDTVQAATDLGENRVQIYMSSYAILRPQTEAGRIKLLAVNGRERIPMLPSVPTVFEAGYPALEYEGLVGLFGLTTMSKDLIAKIGADVVAATKDSAGREWPQCHRASGQSRGTTRICGLHRRPARANRKDCRDARYKTQNVSAEKVSINLRWGEWGPR